MNRLPTVALFAVCASLGLVALVPPAVLAQTASPRPITVEDSVRIRAVHEPQLSPDAKSLAYTVTTSSIEDDTNKSRIWMVPISPAGATAGDPIALTSENTSSTHPRWSPDGKCLAFLSARNDGKTQIWTLNRLGGEAQKITDVPEDVEEFAWSPDSRRIALIFRDPTPEDLQDAKDGKDRDSGGEPAAGEKKKKTPKPWVIDRLQFKQDERGYLDRRRTHIYVFDLAAKSLTQVTSGDFDDAELAWSPDSKQIVFASNRTQPEPDASFQIDIWVVSADTVDKGAHPTKISSSPAENRWPTWSPDGKFIAFASQLEPTPMDYAPRHLAIAPSTGGPARVLTQRFDRTVSAPQFSPDGRFIYFMADDDGTQSLCSVAVYEGEVTKPIGGREMVYDYSIGKTGEIAAQISRPDRPDEIYFLPATNLDSLATQTPPARATPEPTRLTHVNDAIISQLRLVAPEYVHFKSKDGTMVSGFVYKPLDYVPGKRVPTLLRVHGGPVYAWYSEFEFTVQVFAANGYAVLLPNPRGSSGYGQKYSSAISADWGNKDYEDEMAFVDYAIEMGIADPDKLGVGGRSYGAMSTNFIIAQTTRFKAAVSDAGQGLAMSLFGADDYQREYKSELGLPWENRALWERLSPFYKVKNIITPTLFLGGDADSNVPILGSEQMYLALKSLGRATELVVYPGEYHEFSTPSYIQDRLRRLLAWYNHYVKGSSSPATLPADSSKAPIKAVSQAVSAFYSSGGSRKSE